MNKLKKQIIGLSIIVLVLIAGIIFLILPGEKEETSTGTQILRQTDTASITSITVENESGTYIAVQSNEQLLSIEGYESLPLNEEVLQSLFYYASYIRGQIAVKNENNSLETYGLASPLSHIEVACKNGETYTLDIGSYVPGQSTADSLYILYEDKIYTTYKLHVEPFLMAKTDYLQHQITPVSLSSSDPNVTAENMLSITSASLSRSDWDLPVTIQKQEDQDVMGYSLQQYTISLDGTQNYEYTTDSIGNTLLNSFFNLSADSIVAIHPGEDEMEQYGLAQPYFKADITYQNVAGTTGEFSFICSACENGTTYIKNSTADIIYGIAQEPAFLSVNSQELISSYLLTPDINDLTSLQIETKDSSYEFTITSENNLLQSVEMNQISVIAEVFQTFYQALITIKADEVHTSDMLSGDFPLEATVTYTFKDGSQQQIILYQKSARELLAVVDNSHSYTINQTKWDNLLSLISQLQPNS